MSMMKGTTAFVKALQQEGIDTVFGYPGGYVIDIMDELYLHETIEIILPRHEQGLIHAADGYARATGKVGVCLVTSGPGATNLVTGIATAYYDSVPLVCFTGQVPTHLIGNDAFQEVDIIGMTRSISKYCVTVRDRKDLVRIIKEAFYIARTGRPGPVIVDLPKDIMLTKGEDDFTAPISIRGYKPSNSVHNGQIKKAMELLHKAKKPLFLIGGGVKISEAGAELTKLVELTRVPVVTTIMGKGTIPTTNEYYVGNLGMHGSYAANMAIHECDLLFSIGTRFSDRITGKVDEFAKNAIIIHVDIESASISRNIRVDIPIVSDAKKAIDKMLERAEPCDTLEWLQTINNWRLQNPILKLSNTNDLTPHNILAEINQRYQDGIIVTDVGQHQMWTTQLLEMNGTTQLITSGGLGTMGYGFPASIGAKLGNMERQVVCISGDGGIQMNIQELAMAVSLELPIIICIFNNGYLGMVRQWQELFYDKRYASTCLRYRRSCKHRCEDGSCRELPYSPDFVKLAESYGAQGYRVFKVEDMAAAFEKAELNTNSPTILEFMIDYEEKVFPMVQGGKALHNMIRD